MTPDINAIEERRKRLYKSDADNVYVEDYLADTEFLLNRINDLTTQLAEAKADYEAAVEDIRRYPGITPCYYCKNNIVGKISEKCKVDGRTCFEYRGRKSDG